jgi:hypothetical protein
MIYFIHQQSGSERQKECIKFLIKIGNLTGSKYKILIVDNQLKESYEFNNIEFIPSGNKFREFSGWEAGLTSLRNRLSSTQELLEGLIISNDTMLQHRIFDNGKFKGFIEGIDLYSEKSIPILFGDIDRISVNPPYYNNLYSSEYVSTYLFYMNKAGFQLIDSFVVSNIAVITNEIKNCTSVVSGDAVNSEAKNYYQYIEKWLYQNNSGYKWYKHRELTIDNYSEFKLKFESIVMEHFFSQIFIKKGGELVDWNLFVNRSKFTIRLDYLLKKIIYKFKLLVANYK